MTPKRIYFDTSVYNRLLAVDGDALIKQICDLKRRGNSQIGFSAMVWEEFAHTHDAKRRETLFDMATTICDPIFLREPAHLMRADMKALVLGHDPYRYYFGDFADWMRRGRDGREIDQAPAAVFEGFKEHKKGFVPDAKTAQKRHELDPYLLDDPDKPFAKFSKDYRTNQRLTCDIRRICLQLDPKIGEEAYAKINPQQMPRSFEGYYEHLAAMIFSYHFKKIVPRRNDNTDLSHAIYFFHTDLIVTNDRPMVEIAMASPQLALRIVHFDDFLKDSNTAN